MTDNREWAHRGANPILLAGAQSDPAARSEVRSPNRGWKKLFRRRGSRKPVEEEIKEEDRLVVNVDR